MSTNKEELRTLREKRIVTATELGTPDRVPWVPKVAGFIQYDAGSNYYMAMQDSRNQEDGYRQFVRRYDPDAVTCYKMYNIPVMDALKPVHLKYPGPEYGLPVDSAFQHLDGVFLKDDEYKEFIEDHTQFIISKLWPRKFANLAGLSKINVHQLYEHGIFAEMTAFADSEVQDALRALGEAGRAQIRRNQQDAYVEGWLDEEGYCSFAQGSMVNAFDLFADCCRGITQITMDTILHADELMQALHVVHDYAIAGSFARFKAAGAKRIFIPLHCGVDEFMSPKTYEKFYWPFLKKIIVGLIDAGITPWVFCEGKYNTRLDCISDVPKGKVIYSFEEVDMKRVKETVGKVACITGNLPTALLAFGTPERVVEETKRLLDVCAPGGGFIMDCSIVLDNGKRENMLAWREATEKYGRY